MINMKNIRIGILGLGYVGLPLAIEFGKLFDVEIERTTGHVLYGTPIID